jgi:hypothetical protein
MNPGQSSRPPLPSCSLRILAAVVAVSSAPLLRAIPISYGELTGSFDTNLSLGASWRLSDPDPDYFGLPEGGNQYSLNADDGNLNYPQGLSSLILKGTSDLELRYKNWRGFFRATYFYDHENEDGRRARTPLTPEAKRLVGSDIRMLDYFVSGRFEVGSMPLDVRLGAQVLSWGESTFIQNGINTINPIDASRIRVPGAELKDALMPVPMVSFSLGLTQDLSIEGFYQLAYQETEIDPPGSYFSTNDFAGEGGRRVYLGFGRDPFAAARGALAPVADLIPRIVDGGDFGAVPRDERNHFAKDSGQWGLAARLWMPALNNTEFGFYYLNYHSRLPLISARTPPTGVSTPFVVGRTSTYFGTLVTPALVGAGIPAEAVPATIGQLLNAQFAANPAALPASLQPFYAATRPAFLGSFQVAQGEGLLTAAGDARYLVEYPEDISLLGMSFNTLLESTGVALQGEVSYRRDQPLQVDDVELLFAALSSLSPATFGPNNQLGAFGLDTYVSGYRRHEVWQAQATATKAFGRFLGAGQFIVLAEVGMTHVPDLPSQNVLRYDGAGTFTGGDAEALAATGNGDVPVTPAKAFADRTSWGYQLVMRLDYSNVFLGVNVSPLLAFAHDVSGNTPLPLGNFLDGRTTTTLGADFSYLNDWIMELRYVNYAGGSEYNLLADRDFVSATVKYSF